MDEKIRFSGWAAWLDGDSIWWCQDEHCGSAPMQPRTGFEEDMLDEIRRLRAELAECREDAERWRYLRDDGCGFEITVREENEDGYESWVSGYPGAELDAAIDAARKGEGE